MSEDSCLQWEGKSDTSNYHIAKNENHKIVIFKDIAILQVLLHKKVFLTHKQVMLLFQEELYNINNSHSLVTKVIKRA